MICPEDERIPILRSVSDYGPGQVMMCKCGKVGLDLAALMYRILGNREDWENLSIRWEE